jgi:hypothetical protein
MEGVLKAVQDRKVDSVLSSGCKSGEVGGANDKGAPVCVPENSKEAEQAAEEALVAGLAVLIRRYDLPVTLEPLSRAGRPISASLAKTAASTKRPR